MLQLFRHLSNELKASLVCLGIADAREAIAGDTQLARRLDQLALPRWKADEEFQTLVVAILRSLPLRRPSALSAHSLRTLARVTDGITAPAQFVLLVEFISTFRGSDIIPAFLKGLNESFALFS